MSIIVVVSTPFSCWKNILPVFVHVDFNVLDPVQLDGLYEPMIEESSKNIPEFTTPMLIPDLEQKTKIEKLLASVQAPFVLGSDILHNDKLLDFWADSHPEAHFLLFYSRPESALVQSMEKGLDPVVALEYWQSAADRLLAFYRHNRRKTSLINIESSLVDPESFRQIFLQQFAPNSKAWAGSLNSPEERTDVFSLIAEHLVIRNSDILKLTEELEASSLPINNNNSHINFDCSLFYKKFKSINSDFYSPQKLNRGKTPLIESDNYHQHDLDDALKKLSVLREQYRNLEVSRIDIKQDNELLLLQLKQVQEELEYYFLEWQDLSEKLEKIQSGQLLIENIKSPRRQIKKRLLALFHHEWYQKQAGKKLYPLRHYLKRGWKEKMSPHPLFDPNFYVSEGGLSDFDVCPLLHFVTSGFLQGISPHPLFDIKWYWRQYPDVKESGINPLIHYLEFGAKEMRNPSPKFNTQWYIIEYPDVTELGLNPLVHFLMYGEKEGRIGLPA